MINPEIYNAKVLNSVPNDTTTKFQIIFIHFSSAQDPINFDADPDPDPGSALEKMYPDQFQDN